MLHPLKLPKDFDQLIAHLRVEHGLQIADKVHAKSILQRINYYRLSAYGIGLYQPDNKELFVDGITIEHLYSLHQFDCRLRNIITPVIEAIEIELRARISHHMVLKYGSEVHKDSSVFINKFTRKGENIYDMTIKRFDAAVEKGKNMPCVKHHNDKYGGHFPFWAAVELFSFGMLSSLYSVMKNEDRFDIAVQYNTDGAKLSSWMLSLIEVRNICAHYGRIYNMPLAQRPFLYREYKKYASNKIFPVLLTMKRINTNHLLWKSFSDNLESLIAEYPEAKLSFMGFPNHWKALLRG